MKNKHFSKLVKNYKEILTEDFSTSTTGMSYYDEVINDKYYAERKSRFTKIIQMSPKKYIESCVKGFNTNRKLGEGSKEPTDFETLVKSRTDNSLEELKNKLQTTEIDMPVLEYSVKSDDFITFTQEGLHRAIAAMQLGYDKIPVLITVSRRYDAEDSIDNFELKLFLDHLTRRLSESYEEPTMKQLLEKLRKILIEPQQKDIEIYDEMEDETGMNKVTEEVSSAQLGALPSPSAGHVTVNNNPWTMGKHYKPKKKKSIKEINIELEKFIEDVDMKTDKEKLADWLDKMNFKSLKSTEGIKYSKRGNNYNHFISLNDDKLRYVILKGKKPIYNKLWTLGTVEIEKVLDIIEGDYEGHE